MSDECLPSIFCSSEKHYGFSIRFLQQVFDDLRREKKREGIGKVCSYFSLNTSINLPLSAFDGTFSEMAIQMLRFSASR